MTKQSGLGDGLLVAGVDLSGDIGSLGAIGGGNNPLVVTGIDKSGFERLGGLRDGRIEYQAWFNDAAGQAHPTLSTLPTADRIVTYLRGTTLGSPGASLVAKQIDYNPTRGADGGLSIAGSTQGNGFGLEWGDQLTDGAEFVNATGLLAGLDYGAGSETDLGLQAYLHVVDFDGTDATISIHDSDDDASTDPYAIVTGASFTQVTGAPVDERIATGATENVKRWLAVDVAGTFTDITFCVVVVRNLTAPAF